MAFFRCTGQIALIAGVLLTSSKMSMSLEEAIGPDGSNARAVHERYGETGEGINIALISARNARITHEAFKDTGGVSHAFWYDFTGVGVASDNHDTWMAGIAVSRGGINNLNDIGVAPGADLHSGRVDDGNLITFTWLEDALEELVINQNCRVVMTGIAASSPEPDGQSAWTMLYDYYAYEHNAVFAVGAGNDDTVISIFGDAYNGITTGGLIVTEPDVYRQVGSVSGSGPTADERRKPDITGPTQFQTIPTGTGDTNWFTTTSTEGKTSFSTPHTAGVAALLLGLADDTAEVNDGQNEVIKAVIVNSTFPNIFDKSGISTAPAAAGNEWHEDRGYGRLDALRAYETLAAGTGLSQNSNNPTTKEKGWVYATTANNEQHVYYLRGYKNHRLVLTVTWNRRISYNGVSYTEESAPKYNLDLTIIDPLGGELFKETDTLNNLVKADRVMPREGTYEIRIKNTTNRTGRSYGLAFEILPPLPGDFDLNYIVELSDLAFMAGQWLQSGSGLRADLWPDNEINLPDFAQLAHQWLVVDERYYSD